MKSYIISGIFVYEHPAYTISMIESKNVSRETRKIRFCETHMLHNILCWEKYPPTTNRKKQESVSRETFS